MPFPLGAAIASWSKVITLPPAFKTLRRAPSVTLRAQICCGEHQNIIRIGQIHSFCVWKNFADNLAVSLGMSWILTSSVTVPTTTAVLFSRPGIFILRIWLWRKQRPHHQHTSSQPFIETARFTWMADYTRPPKLSLNKSDKQKQTGTGHTTLQAWHKQVYFTPLV